ncbi:MAG: hypothetical protein VX304_11695 [Planctomycetota bacterium]|nr:hypothetical protein [Planctomycetota bacterium]
MTRLKTEPARWVSLAFWGTLFTATVLYGLVTIAPDLLTLGDLAEHESENRAVKMALEDQVRYLEQVRATLKAEPDYASELAHLDIQDARPDVNRLKVDESLRLARLDTATATTPTAGRQWTTRPVVAALAHNDRLKNVLLVIAAGMVLFAFSALQDSHAEHLAHWTNRLRRR